MKKGMCELCNNKARLHCESDQARLCWECDEKVHGANFLVAKHCRSLLCHVCQNPTPWKASGSNLSQTISVCVNCSDNKNSRIQQQQEEEEEEINQPRIGNHETESEDDDVNQESSSRDEDVDAGEEGYDDDDEDEDDDDDDEEDEDEEEDEDDGENQVVPWFDSPPMASSSSCSEEEAPADGGAASVISTCKRIYQTDYLDSIEDERSLHQTCGMSSLSSLRPWKIARKGDSRSITTDPERT